jgi:hypothetical protein
MGLRGGGVVFHFGQDTRLFDIEDLSHRSLETGLDNIVQRAAVEKPDGGVLTTERLNGFSGQLNQGPAKEGFDRTLQINFNASPGSGFELDTTISLFNPAHTDTLLRGHGHSLYG